MDNEEYRHALDLIESASPTKGKAALDAAVRKAYDIGRLEGQEEGRNDRNLADYTAAIEAAKQVERKAIGQIWQDYEDLTVAEFCDTYSIPEAFRDEPQKSILEGLKCGKRPEE